MHPPTSFDGHPILTWISTRTLGSSVDPYLLMTHPLHIVNVCLGSNSSNFTATNQLFRGNPSINYWRFEVVYTLPSGRSSSAVLFLINQPPRNGSCSMTPLNGTTSTSFTLTCSRWQDEDGIKDYSIYSGSSSVLLPYLIPHLIP